MSFKKVLVLDDNRFNREVMKDALTEAGHNCETVEDLPGFEKAVEWWRPDVAVVDVNLPGISGVDVVKRIKKSRETPLPVILLSAMAPDALSQLANECGAEGFYSTLEGVRGLTTALADLYDKLSNVEDSGIGW